MIANGAAPWILHLELEEFMVQVERAADPRLASRPLVIGGETVTTGVVAAASREAQSSGVRAGMLLAQARFRCPNAAYVAGALDRYLAASAAIDEIVRRETDVVEWLALDEAVFTPSVANAADLRALIERVRHACARELGLLATVGAAASRTAARVAARLARPSGVLFVLPGYERRFLASWDLGLLKGLSPATERRLRSAGVDTLGDVASLPKADLRAAVGGQADALLAQVQGRDTHLPSQGWQAPRSLSRTIRCQVPICTVDEALPLVRVMMGELLRTARVRGYFARSMALRVEGPQVRASRACTLRTSSTDETEWTSAAFALIRRIWRGLERRPVVTISATLAELSCARGQLPLFEQSASHRSAREPALHAPPPASRALWHALWAAKAAVGPQTRRRPRP